MLLGSFYVRHGAGTGLREILKAHGKSGGKMGDSTLEEVSVSVVNQNYHQISVDILFLRKVAEHVP